MAKRKHRHQRQRDGVIGPALRPVAWSALLSAALAAAGVATPAYAAPPLPVAAYAEPGAQDQVPDAGDRPQPAGLVRLPGATTSPTSPFFPAPVVNTTLGPLALQITAAETALASVGEQLKQLAIEREEIQTDLATLADAWQEARTALSSAETRAKAAAEAAYKRAAELPPGAVGSDLHGLGALSRLQKESPTGSEAEASQLKRAQEVERAAQLAHSDAETRQQDTAARYAALQTTFHQHEQALLTLRNDNSSQLTAIEREREAQEQRLGAGYSGGDTIAGLQAHPKAKQAVRFALAQLGESYVWGAEGPNTWDCSGLMWGAYRSAGLTLPRVSRAQYQATKTRTVSPNALLPGDLLFFSSSRTDASKIHHVGMYIGGGKMVHAPTTGDVVKISTVWWSRFYAATRVVGAVPAPATPPSQTPQPTPTTPSPTPTTPSPRPTNPASPRPTNPASPKPTPPATPPTTPTPTPGPTTQPPAPTATAAPDTPSVPAEPDPPTESGSQPSATGNASADSTATTSAGDGS